MNPVRQAIKKLRDEAWRRFSTAMPIHETGMADAIHRHIPAMKTKTFDCVEMKNRLQAELREQEQRLGPEEIRRRRQHWLATGEDGLARWWRTIPSAVPSQIPKSS